MVTPVAKLSFGLAIAIEAVMLRADAAGFLEPAAEGLPGTMMADFEIAGGDAKPCCCDLGFFLTEID